VGRRARISDFSLFLRVLASIIEGTRKTTVDGEQLPELGKNYRGRGVVVHGPRLPDLGKNYRGRGKNYHGSRLPDQEKRITVHGSRFVWYDLKAVGGA
jgi:hypothetical protein